MKRLIAALFLVSATACGKLGTVQHEGTVNTVVSINEAQLRKYFNIHCEEVLQAQLTAEGSSAAPSAKSISDCTDKAIADLLVIIEDTASSTK